MAVRIYSYISRKERTAIFKKKREKMANKNSFGNSLLSGAAGAIGGGLGTAAVSGITSLFGGSQSRKQRKLNEQAAELNYRYGEMAADNAFARQMKMYERTYQDESYENQVQQMKDAGLSVGLMYGMGAGSGGGMGSTSNAPQGGGAGNQQGGRQAEQQMADMQALQLGLMMQKTKAETKLIEAQADNQKADAENKGAQTETENQKRDIFIEKLRQEGLEKWYQNLTNELKFTWDQNQGENNAVTHTNETLNGFATLRNTSYIGQEIAVGIAKAWAETTNNNAMAGLTNEKAKGYWTELLNATKNADSEATKAAAIKLAAEWNTGEFTNWKTWTELAGDVLDTIIDAAGAVAGMKSAGKKPPMNEEMREIIRSDKKSGTTTKTRSTRKY